MKTAEYLWHHYATDLLPNLATDAMNKNDFFQALAEHDNEIISKIDETIEAIKPKITEGISSNEYYEWTACIAILMELKNKIEGVAK